MLPLNKNLLATLRILRGGVPPSQLLGSGREQFEAGEVAIQNGQIIDIFFVEFDRYVGTISLKLWGLGRHLDLFAGGAHLELGVHIYAGVSVDHDVFKLERLESRTFDSNRVGVRDQVSDRVVTTVIGGGLN